MTIDQNYFDLIISNMYSLFLFVLITYSEHVNLGAHSILLSILFSINALILGVVNYLLQGIGLNDVLQKLSLCELM
jgi:hypothetical protein